MLMSEQVIKGLKSFGLTPWQLVLAVVGTLAWAQTLSPIPARMQQMSDSLAKLSTQVEIHGVLINQMQRLDGNLEAMRKELSRVEGKLAHVRGYGGGADTP
jgi:hypothetical protein